MSGPPETSMRYPDKAGRFSGTSAVQARGTRRMLVAVRTAPLVGPDDLDASTLERAAAGDRAASRALVERYQAAVFALVSRMLWPRGRATIEDVAQDTFLRGFA